MYKGRGNYPQILQIEPRVQFLRSSTVLLRSCRCIWDFGHLFAVKCKSESCFDLFGEYLVLKIQVSRQCLRSLNLDFESSVKTLSSSLCTAFFCSSEPPISPSLPRRQSALSIISFISQRSAFQSSRVFSFPFKSPRQIHLPLYVDIPYHVTFS